MADVATHHIQQKIWTHVKTLDRHGCVDMSGREPSAVWAFRPKPLALLPFRWKTARLLSVSLHGTFIVAPEPELLCFGPCRTFRVELCCALRLPASLRPLRLLLEPCLFLATRPTVGSAPPVSRP